MGEGVRSRTRSRRSLKASVEELWGRYRIRMPYLVRCRPEVMDGLARLREAGWKVAIVTNGMADNQLGKLGATGLADAVDAYALSGVEGIRNPGSAWPRYSASSLTETPPAGMTLA